VNADPATTADAAKALSEIDRDTYLGTMLQNASNPKSRLPEAVKPSDSFDIKE
jgi:hypothetical protein